MRLVPSPVRAAAAELGLAIAQPERIRDSASVARIEELAPELIVVVAYGQIIPRSILALPPGGIVNVHASLLPRHRGAAPIAHAILAGDAVTGVTIMRMDELLDHGPLLEFEKVPVGARETAPELTGRLAAVGARLLAGTVDHLDLVLPVAQDHARATMAPRLRKEDGWLRWEMSAVEIDRRVRALQPWPGTTVAFRGRMVKVIAGTPVDGEGEPGSVLGRSREGPAVATGAGAYRLATVQLPGRGAMPGNQLLSLPDAGESDA